MTICSACGGVWDEVGHDHCPRCGSDKELAWGAISKAVVIVWAVIIIGIMAYGA